MINDDEATFGYYMIGVFDVLGQSRKLRKQIEMPLNEDPDERQRIVDNLKDTVGVVLPQLSVGGCRVTRSCARV